MDFSHIRFLYPYSVTHSLSLTHTYRPLVSVVYNYILVFYIRLPLTHCI